MWHRLPSGNYAELCYQLVIMLYYAFCVNYANYAKASDAQPKARTVCLRAAAVAPHIAGKLSRRSFRKCIIRVLDVGKFGQRAGKVLF